MCRCVCGRACAVDQREIATYVRSVLSANWVGDRLASWLPCRPRVRWDTDRGACGCAHECVWPRVSTSLHVLYAVRTVSPLKHLDTHRKRHKSALSLTDAHPRSIHTRPTEIQASYGYSSLRMRERYTRRGGRKARLAPGKALLSMALHVPLRVRASVCGREERDRDILEAIEAGELGRRQARQLVAVQTEVAVGHR